MSTKPTEVVVRRESAATVVHTFADLERMAVAVANSKMFGVKTKEEALSLMLLAQAEGRHPAIAARDYHIIDGRPALKADAMLARFMEAGGKVEWHEITDKQVSATFMNTDGGKFRVEWTIATAAVAGLADRPNWKKYPRQMLRSRVVSEGVRTIMPSVIVGTYTPEELTDGDVEIREVVQRGETVEAAERTVIEGELIQAAPEGPKMPEGQILDYLASVEAASTLEDLQKAHAIAYKAAYDLGDMAALKQFDGAKKRAKEALMGVAT